MEKGLWFKQSSLIACDQQPSRGAPAAGTMNLKSKLLSPEELNHGLSCETAG